MKSQQKCCCSTKPASMHNKMSEKWKTIVSKIRQGYVLTKFDLLMILLYSKSIIINKQLLCTSLRH